MEIDRNKRFDKIFQFSLKSKFESASRERVRTETKIQRHNKGMAKMRQKFGPNFKILFDNNRITDDHDSFPTVKHSNDIGIIRKQATPNPRVIEVDMQKGLNMYEVALNSNKKHNQNQNITETASISQSDVSGQSN